MRIISILRRIKNKLTPRRKFIHVLGDSHSEVFDQIKINGYQISVCTVWGATASGITNPNSQTNARGIFDAYLSKNVRSKDILVLMLGEVDCGFIIWLRAQSKNVPVNEQLSDTIEKYINFIRHCKENTTKKIMICSSILPTIKDGTYLGEIANLRKEVKATQYERTKLTLEFNEALRNYCKETKTGFIDLDSSLLNPETRLVKDIYLNPDPTDHHLNADKLAILLSNLLSQNIKNND